MIGFFVKSDSCHVIPAKSIHNDKNTLKQIIHGIPYSQTKCSICLNTFLENVSELSHYDLNNNCLNTEWFQSRLLILKCNHIFHLCCFTKHIKHQYEKYMFDKFELDINEEIDPTMLPLPDSVSSSSDHIMFKIDKDTTDDSILYEEDVLIESIKEELCKSSECNKSNEYKTISESRSESYYDSENDNSTHNHKYNTFKMECPLCKDKLNCFSALTILEKYKMLLELYS